MHIRERVTPPTPCGRIVLRDGDKLRRREYRPRAARTPRRSTGTVVRPGPRVAGTESHLPRGARLPRRCSRARTTWGTWNFVICSLAVFMGVLDNLVVLFALPSIQRELHATGACNSEWTVNAFTLHSPSSVPPPPTLGFPLCVRLRSSGIGLFTLASAACPLGAERRRPPDRACRAGHRGGRDDAALAAGSHAGTLPGSEARSRPRSVVGHRRARDRGRARRGASS